MVINMDKMVQHKLEAATHILYLACAQSAQRVRVQHSLDLDCKLVYFAFQKQGH